MCLKAKGGKIHSFSLCVKIQMGYTLKAKPPFVMTLHSSIQVFPFRE